MLLGVAILCGAASSTAAGGAPTVKPKPKTVRVTFIGDSVSAAIDEVAVARRQLSRGLRMKLDLRVCRRLASQGCPYDGSTPPSALASVIADGRGVGDVLVVDVGYNEGASGYRSGMDRIIRTAFRNGVKGIVWVLLRQTRNVYYDTNIVIQSEARRWKRVLVADWNTYSAGQPWFDSDGLHLNAQGAQGLAELVRPYVLRASHLRAI